MSTRKSSFVFRWFSVFMLLALLVSAPALPAQAKAPEGLGGPPVGQGNRSAVDLSGNTFSAGVFSGTVVFGATSLSSAGGLDIFVTKTDSRGNLLWVKSVGGAQDDVADGIAVDSSGNVTITHQTGSGESRYVSRYDSNGGVIWSKFAVGTGGSISSEAEVNRSSLPAAVVDGSGLGGAQPLLPQPNIYSGVFYVKPTAIGVGNCQSWANACTLQTALTVSASGDTIWVRQGTYKPTLGAVRTITFTLKNGVAVYGGFAGTETALAQRSTDASLTILSGDLLGNDNDLIPYNEPTRADNSYHVVTGATGATLDGFTITGGNAADSGGGGMFNSASSPTLSNLIFSMNSAVVYGGAMYNIAGSSPSLTNITFNANYSGLNGGAIRSENGSNLTLTNVTFTNNYAGNSGGALSIRDSSPILNNVTLSGNTAAYYGGGIENYSASPTLTNVTITGNTTDFGGGVFNELSNVTLTNVTITGNTGLGWGDGIYNSNSLDTITIRNSVVWGNSSPASEQIYVTSGTLINVTNSVVQNGCPLLATCTNFIITSDPKLGTLGNYGGLTQTIPLLFGSSAINKGDDAVCPATDQRGASRPWGEHCDIGAFEYQAGGDTTGVFRPSNGLLYLKNTNTTGFADVAINYGIASDYPVAGDWDGNGTSTIGIYRNGSFYLRNSNTIGFADLVFAFGLPGDQPVAGDWDGDGIDTIGVFRNGLFLLRNSNSAGAADASFYLGNPGDVGIAGDWNGDGLDTTGVFRPSNGVIFLKNLNTSGFADVALNYGLGGDQPVIGDWNNDGIDTIGVYRNAQFMLRNSNTLGFADIVFALGNPGDMPIAGNWDALP